MNRLSILLKFFSTSDNGTFRKSLILPFLCIFISSFIISITYSITTGIEVEVEELIKNFTFPYEVKGYENDFDKERAVNYGIINTAIIEKSSSGIKIKSFDNFEKYINSIPDKYYENIISDINDNNILISKRMKDNFRIYVNDEVMISNIAEIKLFPKTIALKVGGVFKNNLIEDFDIIMSNDSAKKIFPENSFYTYYFDNYNDAKFFSIRNEYKINDIVSPQQYSILKWLQIEMLIYQLVSYISIIIASFIVYMNSILVYLEKRKQLSFMHVLGLTRIKIVYYCTINMLASGLMLSLSGHFLTYILIRVNKTTNFMINLIPEPFDPVPMNLGINDLLMIEVIILIMITISFVVPFIKYSKRELFDQIS